MGKKGPELCEISDFRRRAFSIFALGIFRCIFWYLIGTNFSGQRICPSEVSKVRPRTDHEGPEGGVEV